MWREGGGQLTPPVYFAWCIKRIIVEMQKRVNEKYKVGKCTLHKFPFVSKIWLSLISHHVVLKPEDFYKIILYIYSAREKVSSHINKAFKL